MMLGVGPSYTVLKALLCDRCPCWGHIYVDVCVHTRMFPCADSIHKCTLIVGNVL